MTRTPIRGVGIPRGKTEGGTGRARRPSEEHGWSHFEQLVLRGLEKLEDGLKELGERVTKIEDANIAETAADSVKSSIWKWVLGVLAALLVGGLLALARAVSK